MGSVFGSEERALVMIEPPRNFLRRGVFEVEDGIFVAIKIFFVEQSAGTMHEARVAELHVAFHALSIEPRKDSRRTSAVETLIVIEDPNLQPIPLRPKLRCRSGVPEQKTKAH